jgi:hypothetical protein
MKQTVYVSDFIEAFKRMNRQDNFSLAGLEALFEWLEINDGEDAELDVIAICGEFAEYKNLEEFQADYGEEEYQSMDDIQDSTAVIPVGEKGFIIQQF